MVSTAVPLPRFIDSRDIYEEAVVLFASHDKELERVFRITNPEFISKIAILLDDSLTEEYFVKTTIIFHDSHPSEDILSARKILEQKFRVIENIIDLEHRLNSTSGLKTDRVQL